MSVNQRRQNRNKSKPFSGAGRGRSITRASQPNGLKNTRGNPLADLQKFAAGTRFVLMRSPIADSVVIPFRTEFSGSMYNAGFSYLNLQFNMNDLHFSTSAVVVSCPYLFEWGTFYSQYRVINFSYELTLTNSNTTQPVNAICGPLTPGPGIGNNNSVFPNLYGENYFQEKEISIAGGLDRHTFRGSYALAKLTGATTYFNDPGYAGGIAANISGMPAAAATSPTKILFFVFGGSSPLATAGGLYYLLKVNYLVHMFDYSDDPIKLQKRLASRNRNLAPVTLVPVSSTTTTSTTTSSSISECDCDESDPMDYTEY
jgi:hypothetical protein